MLDPDEVNQVLEEADCLFDKDELEKVLNNLSAVVTRDLENKNPLVLTVMTGGIIPSGHLLTRLKFPLQQDYLHATRYQGNTSGSEIEWLHEPVISLKGRTILIIDDIFDIGITLKEITQYCLDKGAKEVKSLVIVNKIHDRKIDFKPDYIGVDIEDRYLFGFGMDYKTYLRNLFSIYAVKDM